MRQIAFTFLSGRRHRTHAPGLYVLLVSDFAIRPEKVLFASPFWCTTLTFNMIKHPKVQMVRHSQTKKFGCTHGERRRAEQEVRQKENDQHRVLKAAEELQESILKHPLGNQRGKHDKGVGAIGCEGNCLKRNGCLRKNNNWMNLS